MNNRWSLRKGIFIGIAFGLGIALAVPSTIALILSCIDRDLRLIIICIGLLLAYSLCLLLLWRYCSSSKEYVELQEEGLRVVYSGSKKEWFIPYDTIVAVKYYRVTSLLVWIFGWLDLQTLPCSVYVVCREGDQEKTFSLGQMSYFDIRKITKEKKLPLKIRYFL